MPHESMPMIRLVGPGGAGKSTVGLALANRLGVPFVDLDEQFAARAGDVSGYVETRGYRDYTRRNVEVYLDTLPAVVERSVFALSSGFMLYDDDIHPEYRLIHQDIVASRSTAALFPSFDYETCVAETVRRQLKRPFSRTAEREEQVIRTRFQAYWNLPVKRFATMRPVDAVVEDLMAFLRGRTPHQRLMG